MDIDKASLISSETYSSNCPFCEEGTLEHVFEFPFLDEGREPPLILPADICNVCGEYLLSEKDMSTLLTETDHRAGNPHKKTVVKDGKIHTYNLH